MGVGFNLFRRNRSDQGPATGAVYRRCVATGVVETARVLAIANDGMNIPHVRFVAQSTIGEVSGSDEFRTLSVESFQRLFPERVPG